MCFTLSSSMICPRLTNDADAKGPTPTARSLYVLVDPAGCADLQFTDEYADTKIEVDGTQGGLRAFGALKKAKDCAHLKVLVSIGGGGEGSAHFAAIARDGAVRMRFANAARAFVDEYGFDGLDSTYPIRSSLADGGKSTGSTRRTRGRAPTTCSC